MIVLMKKIFFCDIDGTIIDGNRGMIKPSIKTKYCFEQLKKDNIVFISSGRSKGLLPDYILELKPNGYVLCNGAYVEYNDECIFQKQFDDNTVEAIKKYSINNNGFYILEAKDDLYISNKDNVAFRNFIDDWSLDLEKLFIIDDNLTRDYFISMIGFSNIKDCENIEKVLCDYVDLVRHNRILSYDCNVKGIDKGKGVQKVLEYLNIDRDNAYSFGDGLNDLEMLLAVNHPVIMANCYDELKKYNFELTDDVLDDGFYNYLVNNMLIKEM